MDERRQGYTELTTAVAVLSEKVETIHDALFGNGKEGVLAELDHRISTLETFKVWVQGVAAAIGGIFATVLAVLGLRR